MKKFFLTKFHFLTFQKWPKINFWTGKKFKTAKNATSQFFIYLISWVFLPGLFLIFWPAVCVRNKKKLQKEKKNKLNCRCDDYDKCMFKGKLGFQLLRHESALKGPLLFFFFWTQPFINSNNLFSSCKCVAFCCQGPLVCFWFLE